MNFASSLRCCWDEYWNIELSGPISKVRYTDDIRKASKITCKMAGEYLGISLMAVSIGMRNNLLSIGYALRNAERD